MSLRVVVVTWCSSEVLQGFLSSLATATTRPYEVVVVDSASPEGPPEVPPGVGLVVLDENVGYGSAANRGAEGYDGEWLLVANPDLVWDEGSLDALLEAGERWPDAGCLGPAIRTKEGALYPSARAFPSLGRGLGHAVFGWWWPRNPWTRAYRAERGDPVEGPTGWLSGSLMLMRNQAFQQVGGFDPRYFMYCEDMDLCRRLAEAGWASIYAPSAVITHFGGHSTRVRENLMQREHHRALYRYLSEHHRGWRWAPLRWLLAAGLALRYLVASAVPSMREGAAPTRSARVLDS